MTLALRDNLIRAKAWYYYGVLAPDFLPDYSLDDMEVQAIWIGSGDLPHESWILFKGNDSWTPLGFFIDRQTFFLKAEMKLPDLFLYFESLDGQQKKVKCPTFPYPWTEFRQSRLFLYDCGVERILENIAVNSEYDAAVPGDTHVNIKGVYAFTDLEDLLQQLIETTRGSVQIQGKSLVLREDKGNEFVVWKYSTVYWRNFNSRNLATSLLENANLAIGGGAHWIKDKKYLVIRSTDTYWMDLFEK